MFHLSLHSLGNDNRGIVSETEKQRKKRNGQTKREQFEWAQRTKNIKIASRSCKKSHMVVGRVIHV